MTIFLVGYMGSGKSCIGRELAKRTGFRFIDTDKLVEAAAGISVTDIFAVQGESAFRSMERDALLSIDAGEGDTVVATGGGLPCAGDNMRLINERGHSVYLKLNPEKLVSRLSASRNKRPLLAGMDYDAMLRFVTDALAVREPFYSQASMTIDCNGVSDDYICRHIEMYIQILKAGG
jgi:shikimate kinase